MIDSTDFSKSEHYTLSIRISTDGFSFSLFNTYENHPPIVETIKTDPSISITGNLRKIIDGSKWIGKSYRKILINYVTTRYLLVPLELFEDDKIKNLFYFNFQEKDNEDISYKVMQSDNVVMIYGIDKSIVRYIEKIFPDATIIPQSAFAFEFYRNRSKLGNTQKCYVLLHESSFDLFVFEKTSLLFNNTYRYSSTEDILYYVLHIWKSMDLLQETDELHFSGVCRNKEELVEKSKQFINKVFITTFDDTQDLSILASCV